jgi:hypothetical protein
MSLQAGLDRLDEAIRKLERSLAQSGGRSPGNARLDEELHRLGEDRSRLAETLDRAESRAARLEETNREVSRRLVAAMESIRSVLERHGG